MATVGWLQQPSLVWLGTLRGGKESFASGVSADGSVVVGAVEIAAGQLRTFRWTRATGVEVLDLLADPCGEVYGVSADGSVVVGTACISSSIIAASVPRAFRWTRAMGMEDLTLTYAHLLTDGSVLEEVRAISPSGRYIVGNGRNATTWRKEAFLLDTGVLQLGIRRQQLQSPSPARRERGIVGCGGFASAHAEADASALQTCPRAAHPSPTAWERGWGVRAKSGRTLHTANSRDVP
jgi:probable HAF family extracellular repeat protein